MERGQLMSSDLKKRWKTFKELMGYKERPKEDLSLRQKAGRAANVVGDGLFNYRIFTDHIKARAKISVLLWSRLYYNIKRIRDSVKKPKHTYDSFEEVMRAYKVNEDDLRRSAYRYRFAGFVSFLGFLFVGYFLPFTLIGGSMFLIALHLVMLAYLPMNFLRGEWRYQQYKQWELMEFSEFLRRCLPWETKAARK